MTQSGQGEPAREGIVLPSDGGEPLLPGRAGEPAPHPVAPAGQTPPGASPAGGRTWGSSWGPDQQGAQPGQGWPAADAQQWGEPRQPAAWQPEGQGTPGAGPLPPEGAPAPSYGGTHPNNDGYGAQDPAYGAGPQPSYGADAQSAYPPGGADPHRQPYPAGGHAAQGLPGSHAAPLPPAQSGPLPPAVPVDEGATQYIPPVAAGPGPADEGATQYIPPVAAGPGPADEGATQYLPPVPAGALPPEAADDRTHFLGHTVQAPPTAPNPDAEPTQYIAPVSAGYGDQGGERQPPAEFDNLFRSAPGDPAPATQQLPRFDERHDPYAGQPQQAYTPQGPGGGGRRGGRDDDGAGRGGSRVPLIAAIGVGIVVVGVGAGVLLGGGGGDGDKSPDSTTVAASESAAEESASPGADPAREQAVALDELLADSGNSRSQVISAVANVKACKNLDGAADDLRDAAKQRGALVTRLSKLSLDKLPNSSELTSALTQAWQASAAADSHYAAWADQVGAKHGCPKGHARLTKQSQAANQSSVTASSQKGKAAPLWNSIAEKYGLTQRQPTQL